jgi:hypothetical protein
MKHSEGARDLKDFNLTPFLSRLSSPPLCSLLPLYPLPPSLSSLSQFPYALLTSMAVVLVLVVSILGSPFSTRLPPFLDYGSNVIKK